MVKVTREEYRILYLHDFDTDGPLLAVRYTVEGDPRRLIVEHLLSSGMTKEEEKQIAEALLPMCDEEAQWSADHPDQDPEYEWVPSIA